MLNRKVVSAFKLCTVHVVDIVKKYSRSSSRDGAAIQVFSIMLSVEARRQAKRGGAGSGKNEASMMMPPAAQERAGQCCAVHLVSAKLSASWRLSNFRRLSSKESQDPHLLNTSHIAHHQTSSRISIISDFLIEGVHGLAHIGIFDLVLDWLVHQNDNPTTRPLNLIRPCDRSCWRVSTARCLVAAALKHGHSLLECDCTSCRDSWHVVSRESR